jgi:hypothetical protein
MNEITSTGKGGRGTSVIKYKSTRLTSTSQIRCKVSSVIGQDRGESRGGLGDGDLDNQRREGTGIKVMQVLKM